MPAKDGEELVRSLRVEAAQVVAELARMLRALVDQVQLLGTSQNALARRIHVSSASMSRYLSGERVPDWSVVEALLDHVQRLTKQEIGDSARERLRELQQHALYLRHPQRHEVQEITAQLQASEEELAGLKIREALLEQQVAELSDRLAGLAEDQVREREEHQAERARLTRELENTSTGIGQAQQRCAELEKRLAEAEERAAAAEQQGSAEPLLGLQLHDGHVSNVDYIAVLEALVEAHAAARTGEEHARVYAQVSGLPWHGGAAALALVYNRYPEADVGGFARAALGHRAVPELLSGIEWLFKHVQLRQAIRIAELVTLGVYQRRTLAGALLALSEAHRAEAQFEFGAVAGAACNLRDDLGFLLAESPSLVPILADHVSDATLLRRIHGCERALRTAKRDKRDIASARGALQRMLRLLTCSTPNLAATRILVLTPELQDMAFAEAARDARSSAASLTRLAKTAVGLRRRQQAQTAETRDLATVLLQHAVQEIESPVPVANLLSTWVNSAAEDGERLTVRDRVLVLSIMLKTSSPDDVSQLLTHTVALPPGSTTLVWNPGRADAMAGSSQQTPRPAKEDSRPCHAEHHAFRRLPYRGVAQTSP